MFRGLAADQLWEFKFTALHSEEFVLYAPRLQSLTLSHAESWSSLLSVNVTHICLESNLNPVALERSLKNCPRLKELSIHSVHQFVPRPGDRSKISLLPGVRLIITNSVKAVASLFALESTNYLSITTPAAEYGLQNTPFLESALPQDISCLRNLNGFTTVHLKLIDTGRRRLTFTVVLKCSTADRETLYIQVDHILIYRDFYPDQMDAERVPMGGVGYLRPLDLGKVAELRMDGFVEGRDIQVSDLRYFLEQMPALRRITTGDDNVGMFSLALGTMAHNVVIERV